MVKGLLFLSILFTSFILFTLPGNQVPTISWLNIPHVDKLIHSIIFFVLSLTLHCWIASLFIRSNSWLFFFILTFLIGYGIGIEFIQDGFIEGRSFEKWDILADSSGCMLYAIFYFWLIRKKVGPCGNRGRNQN